MQHSLVLCTWIKYISFVFTPITSCLVQSLFLSYFISSFFLLFSYWYWLILLAYQAQYSLCLQTPDTQVRVLALELLPHHCVIRPIQLGKRKSYQNQKIEELFRMFDRSPIISLLSIPSDIQKTWKR